ncbi:phosphoribosylanthranilate isomerase [Zeaxanthinibacter enoshimensis]|uniref:N-(5'-phosphoribosyl)anthranilate isomerase n=1 Tax=Zeaxanthinibacter enoshimensis TaxID=392009 RepID=A0A4V3D3P3_9FLAO|nr:phosphoribosylanthranilate isomerase [Zeaxanthinibacter enoshimensis]TDQ30793.1 phosphoribosylanthranilate isomerase [Zeaxanthinibacter enoshimensis]
MKLKICGMNHNTAEVAALKPDYLGFIFWEPSSRVFRGTIPELPSGVKKVGVFVDASLEEILEKIKEFGLHMVQLHGNESPSFCKEFRAATQLEIPVIKAFSVGASFNFEQLGPYEAVCDFYLFDTKGKLPGGNSFSFDWELLSDYPSDKPYFLSGGIGPGDIDSLFEFMHRPEAGKCHALDVNSRFESRPGEKKVADLTKFKKRLAQGR